jgi:hypothetical protein
MRRWVRKTDFRQLLADPDFDPNEPGPNLPRAWGAGLWARLAQARAKIAAIRAAGVIPIPVGQFRDHLGNGDLGSPGHAAAVSPISSNAPPSTPTAQICRASARSALLLGAA